MSVGSSQREALLKARAMSLDLEKAGLEPTRPGRKAGALRAQPLADPPTKVLLVWLESYEDSLTFPVGQYFKGKVLYGSKNLSDMRQVPSVVVVVVYCI